MLGPMINGFIHGFYAVRQALFAAILLLVILAFYNKLSHHLVFNAIGLTSLAATMCLIFLSPPPPMGEPKVIFVGYVIATLVGLGSYYLSQWLVAHPIFIPADYYSIGCAALTLAFCICLMALFRAPHPPAAAFALGIMVDQWDAIVIIVTLLLVLCLTSLKYFLDFKPLIK